MQVKGKCAFTVFWKDDNDAQVKQKNTKVGEDEED